MFDQSHLRCGWLVYTFELWVYNLMRMRIPSLPSTECCENMRSLRGHPEGITILFDEFSNRSVEPYQRKFQFPGLVFVNSLITVSCKCKSLSLLFVIMWLSPPGSTSPTDRHKYGEIQISHRNSICESSHLESWLFSGPRTQKKPPLVAVRKIWRMAEPTTTKMKNPRTIGPTG